MKSTLKFAPVFFLYFFYVLFFAENAIVVGSDESRYYSYAHNILNGYYTDPENPRITNGPGYPFFLVPFLLLNLPPIIPKLFNSVLIFFSVLSFYELLKLLIPPTKALVFAYLLGLYLPLLRVVTFCYTESLTLLLICAVMLFSTKYLIHEKFSLKKALLPAFLLGYLILTRIIFGYVVIAGIFLFGVLYVISKRVKSLKFALIFLLGFLFSTPFLVHNYLLTGKYFYWGTTGGSMLYWMTSHKEKEYGTWFVRNTVLQNTIPGMDSSHKRFYASLDMVENHMERNDRLLEEAMKNIKNNPKAYISNILPNALRMFFGYPNSYVEHNYLNLYFFLFSHIFLLVPFLFSLYPAWVNRSRIPFEINAMMLFIGIYFGGSILLPATPRYVIPTIPFLLLWLGFAYSKLIKISF